MGPGLYNQRLNLLNARVTRILVPSAVDFFSINRSSIKSELQKLIFFQFSEFSIMFGRSGNDRKIDFFLKVLLSLVFGIATPYKQISICPYEH